jgi:RHS repeat-associated protein
MSEKYKFHDPHGMYFVTMATVGWVDLFTRFELKHVIIDSLRYCQKEKGLVIHAWCLMPSHLHLIISSENSLSGILRDFKKHTSKELIATIDRINESRKGWMLDLFSEVADHLRRVKNYKVWQDGNHPELPTLASSVDTEAWTEQAVTVPAGATTLLVGMAWNTTVTAGEVFFVNDVEVNKITTTTPEYQYNLKDHLGNVRVTFTTKDEQVISTASLEDATQPAEQASFKNYTRLNNDLYDHTDAGTVYTYSNLLNGAANRQVGLAKSISVMPGDVVGAEVYAKYFGASGSNTNLAGFGAALLSAFGLAPPGVGETGTASAALGNYGSLIAAGNNPGNISWPKVWLNVLVFDRDYKLVDLAYQQLDGAYVQSGAAKAPHQLLSRTLTIKQPGYVYIYVSNEGAMQQEAYFDDFKVTQNKSAIIESQDFYPFGLTFNSYQRENSVQNKYLYNQGTGEKTFKTERITDLGLNVDMSRDRVYDYITGRWWQVDPKADKGGQESWSTYQYGFDNPVRYNDPYGDCIPCLTQRIIEYSALFASMASLSSKGAMTRLMTNSSSTVQSRAGTNSPVTPVDNKTMAKMGDAKIVAGVASKNTKALTNEVSKDGLAVAKGVGTGLELTGVGVIPGAIINTVAGGLDETRQVAFEGKDGIEAGTTFLIDGVIDLTLGGLGNAAKSTVKEGEAGKELFDKAVNAHDFSLSNLFQWVSDKIRGTENKKDK